MLASERLPLALPSPVQFIIWRDIFVVIDDCTAKASVYEKLREIVADQGAKHASGLGCLLIVPSTATAPSDEVRRAMNRALSGVSLKCLCWLVEGTGFQAAMARAIVTGLRWTGQPSFPTHIATNLEEAVAWMLPRLEGGSERLTHTGVVARIIRMQRRLGPQIVP